MLEQFALARCPKPSKFGTSASGQSHSFADGCLKGYCQVSYLRQVNDRGDIHCAFFFDEIAALKEVLAENHNDNRTKKRSEKTKVKKISSLFRLDPFIDGEGMLRVGGRLSKSTELSENLKHPVLLPKKSHITTLIIRHNHEKDAHAGREMTLNELRSKYWIINANLAVRYYIYKCVRCRTLRAIVGEQKMADLPIDRIIPAPTFAYCAVDYFGSYYIKEGCKQLKRYGVLFTCLASRAIHLERAISFDGDSFINASDVSSSGEDLYVK